MKRKSALEELLGPRAKAKKPSADGPAAEATGLGIEEARSAVVHVLERSLSTHTAAAEPVDAAAHPPHHDDAEDQQEAGTAQQHLQGPTLAAATSSEDHASQPGVPGEAFPRDTVALAVEIEQHLAELHGGNSKPYKTAVRNLVANLKRNGALAQRVVSGELAPNELVRLEPAQLATQEQQAQLAKKQDELVRKATIHESTGMLTSDYACPQCKSSACSYVEAINRGVGKCDTWGAKQHDDRGRTVTCLTCSHRWTADL